MQKKRRIVANYVYRFKKNEIYKKYTDCCKY